MSYFSYCIDIERRYTCFHGNFLKFVFQKNEVVVHFAKFTWNTSDGILLFFCKALQAYEDTSGNLSHKTFPQNSSKNLF